MKSLGVNFSSCPIDTMALEQMILARNRIQHADDITSNTFTHLDADLCSLPQPIFVRETSFNWPEGRRVYIDELKFNDIASQVKSYCSWLETEAERIKNS